MGVAVYNAITSENITYPQSLDIEILTEPFMDDTSGDFGWLKIGAKYILNTDTYIDYEDHTITLHIHNVTPHQNTQFQLPLILLNKIFKIVVYDNVEKIELPRDFDIKNRLEFENCDSMPEIIKTI